jgi:hypothetical protein
MINAPRQPNQLQDLGRWDEEGAAPRSERLLNDPNLSALPKAEPELYYFNIRTARGVTEDPEGDIYPDLQSAREKALADASDIILEGDRVGENRRSWRFEIMDRANQLVLTVLFSEAQGLKKSDQT